MARTTQNIHTLVNHFHLSSDYIIRCANSTSDKQNIIPHTDFVCPECIQIDYTRSYVEGTKHIIHAGKMVTRAYSMQKITFFNNVIILNICN